MLVLEPVIDTAVAANRTLWPVAATAPASMLHVSANVSALDVGAAMAALLPHGLDDADGGPRKITSVLRRPLRRKVCSSPAACWPGTPRPG